MSDNRTRTNSQRIHPLDEQDRFSPVAWHPRAVKRVAVAASLRFVRAFTVVIGVIAGAAAPSLVTAADETPTEFIGTGANAVLAEMRSAASLDPKIAYFRQMLSQDFDMDGISRFVLGPYWRTASPEQQQEFRALLEKHIMLSHGRRLAEAGGGDFRVTGSRTDPNGVVFVAGEIIAPQGARNEVDFQLGIVDGLYRIQDGTIDNVSMVLSYRSEIQSVLASQGWQLGALLTAMSYRRILVTARGSGGGFGLRHGRIASDLHPISELHTLDQFWQLVMAVDPAPTFLGALDQLEDHGERGLVRQTTF